MKLRLVATLDADRLALRFLSGTVHSDVPVIVRNPLDTPAAEDVRPLDPVRRPWSLQQLDAALHRQGYTRTTPWRDGPAADITRPG